MFSFVLATFGSIVNAQALVSVGCCLIDWWLVVHKAMFAWNMSIILVSRLLWHTACTYGLIIKSKQFICFITSLACFSGRRRGAYTDVRMWCFLLRSCLVETLRLTFCCMILCSLVWYSSVQFSTLRYSLVQFGTVWYSSVQFSTLRYSLVQFGTVWYSSVQFSTLRYNLVQFGTVWYSSVQFSTLRYSLVQFGTVQYT